MRVNKILFFMMILSMLSLSMIAQAADDDIEYSLGATVGTEMILEVKTLDEDLLDDTIQEWDDVVIEDAEDLGAKQKMVITKVDDSMKFDIHLLGEEKGFGYEVNLWEWTDEEFEAEPDEEDEKIAWFEDPDDLDDVYVYLGGFSGLMPFVPTPVDAYLADIDYKDNWGYEGNKIINRDEAEEDITITITYDMETGFLKSFTIQNEEGTMIYEIGSVSAIPAYDIPVLLGTTAFAIIGIIVIYTKKSN